MISNKTHFKDNFKKAAIYARVSSKKQKDEETIESQIDALKHHAKLNNYTIDKKHIYLDDGISGTTLQRQALDELRDMIRFEPIDVLLIYSPDRLSRNYTYLLILMEEFRKSGVKVCFMKNPPSSDTPEAKMFQHFQGIFAEYERALIIDRSRRGRVYKAKQGDPSIIPSVPYGYQKVKKERTTTVEIVEEEAMVVKEMFRLYIHESSSLMDVAKQITLKGIKPRKGGSGWDRSTIRDILKNPTYLGVSHFGKTERSDGSHDKIRKYGSKTYIRAKYARNKKPQEEWLAISVPQIISESDFELAQERLKKNKILASRNTKHPSLLQGLVTCGICGKPFYKRVRRNKNNAIGYYYCSATIGKRCKNSAINQEALDKLVLEEVLNLLRNPILIQQEIHRRAKEASNIEELEQREIMSKKELTKLSQETDRLLDAYQSGVLELKELKKRNQKLDELKKQCEKEIQGLQARKLERKSNFDIKKSFEKILKSMQVKAEKFTFNEKRGIVRMLVEQIVIHVDKITLTHCVSPMMLSEQECQLRVGDRL